MSYRISTLSELTGIPIGTITAWERRYDLLHPVRATSSGYRLYSDADVALLLRIRGLLDQGHKISEAIARLLHYDDALAPLRDQLRAHLLAYDRPAAERLRGRFATLPFRQAIDGLYLPLLVEIGEGWANGSVSIAQEHFATAWCRDVIAGMWFALGGEEAVGPRVLCAGFPGDRHEIGILAVAVKLALLGYNVAYLGTDLPLEEVVRLAATRPCDLVCISCVRAWPEADIHTYASRLADAVPPGVRVVIGGPGVAAVAPPPGVWLATRFEDLEGLVARSGGVARHPGDPSDQQHRDDREPDGEAEPDAGETPPERERQKSANRQSDEPVADDVREHRQARVAEPAQDAEADRLGSVEDLEQRRDR